MEDRGVSAAEFQRVIDELAELREDNARLASEVASLRTDGEPTVSRRGLLRGAGAVVAGAGAAVVGSVLNAAPASAAPMTGDSSDPATPAVRGTHIANGPGVKGTSTPSNGGVVPALPENAGVVGASNNGYGVVGGSLFGHGVFGKAHGTAAVGVRGDNTNGGNGVYGLSNGQSGIGAFAGVVGDTDVANGTGVAGLSATGDGVRGTSNLATGVTGDTLLGNIGVYGLHNGVALTTMGHSAAVRGDTTRSSASGVVGIATNGVGVLARGRTQLRLWPNPTAGPPQSDAHGTGEIFADVNGALFQCVSTGTPGTWVRVGFNALVPARICDTRAEGASPLNSYAGAQLAPRGFPGDTLTLVVSGPIGNPAEQLVPLQASAVTVTLTATNIGSSGFLTAYPADAALPVASNVNFPSPAQTFLPAIASQATVKLGPIAGDPQNRSGIKIFNGSHAPIDVIVDLAGFFS